jgi:hypothetical protein
MEKTRNSLYEHLISSTNAEINNWMKSTRDGETKLDIAQQLNLFTVEVKKWTHSLEEEYKSECR